LEVFPATSGKGVAVSKLCEFLALPIAWALAAGDQENDISMLKAAGFAIAMKNAIPEVKEAADIVTEFDNNEDGLAREVERISLL
jgi:hydroxymethylpyrimidine pyrophosphatase-like HAD family hydrolase